ncbi:hypothetical protein HYPSUDRAFT_623646 [Hypholoma sublateritium FD-334 SS-4]|uniref:Uncharacterized protein n=1 Tax=Hypholoma sublateritium (strain FD-334 SS-4) TaxID=945553 RepID=A0A0D2LLM7_HYPSF|nr:hypothetical protein HYPSUDRAFT_623646 [Hypholoma sublateritium FD-334 SS-4]
MRVVGPLNTAKCTDVNTMETRMYSAGQLGLPGTLVDRPWKGPNCFYSSRTLNRRAGTAAVMFSWTVSAYPSTITPIPHTHRLCFYSPFCTLDGPHCLHLILSSSDIAHPGAYATPRIDSRVSRCVWAFYILFCGWVCVSGARMPCGDFSPVGHAKNAPTSSHTATRCADAIQDDECALPMTGWDA